MQDSRKQPALEEEEEEGATDFDPESLRMYEQLERLRDQAVSQVMQDIEQEPSYGRGIVEQYVDGLDTHGKIDSLSQDRDMLHLYLDFDPDTGEEWCEDCEDHRRTTSIRHKAQQR